MNKSNFSPLSGVSESASCSKTERIHNYYNLSAAYLQGEFYSNDLLARNILSGGDI